VRVVATILLVFALGGGVAAADSIPVGSTSFRPAPSGLPNVLCRKPIFPGRAKPTTPGAYAYKPGSCVLEVDEKSSPNENAAHLLSIKWKKWNRRSAQGVGLTPISVVGGPEPGEQRAGREHALITLGHPVRKCGRSVFTRARVLWIGGYIEFSFRLHRVPIIGRGCP
jgi:hypothetical protein